MYHVCLFIYKYSYHTFICVLMFSKIKQTKPFCAYSICLALDFAFNIKVTCFYSTFGYLKYNVIVIV